MIETERLFLRPHVLEDYPAVRALGANSETMRYIADGKPATDEESWIKLQRNVGHWSMLGYGLFAVFDKVSGAYAGDCGLADFHRGLGDNFDPFPEAGWLFSPAFHGKGYAFEAAEAAHRWLAATLGPKRTVCIIAANNSPSIRLAQKLRYSQFGEAQYKGKTVLKLEKITF